MEPLSNLRYLLEPAVVALIVTAVLVVLASAHRALAHEKESERHRDYSEASITLDSSQALMIPVASSVSLLLMFYLFSSMSQLVTAFTAVASASSLAFCLAPYAAHLLAHAGVVDPPRSCLGTFTKAQVLLGCLSALVVAAWLVSGHWLLNNVLGISICVAFVSHVRLPNIRVCFLLLACLFVYDVFWVFFSEHFFGANVMVTVATQQAQNPVHTVAQSLHLPVFASITQKLDLPVKLLFPRSLLSSVTHTSSRPMDFIMLGLGDMAIPGMLLGLVLCFDKRKLREGGALEAAGARPPGSRYMWHAAIGYAVGLVVALAAGVLTRAPQPALLYLVPSTLGPVACTAWARRELLELWNGPRPAVSEKTRTMEV